MTHNRFNIEDDLIKPLKHFMLNAGLNLKATQEDEISMIQEQLLH